MYIDTNWKTVYRIKKDVANKLSAGDVTTLLEKIEKKMMSILNTMEQPKVDM